MILEPGHVLACYRLVSLLGRGGMGEVWLAVDTASNARRAIKVPTDPDYTTFLRREAVMQAALDHPNIVALYELDLTHEPPFVVLEYFESQSLRSVITAGGRLPISQALDYLAQMLEGLHAAHRQGILHRDLKPENILINQDGLLKITDFGLGRVHEAFARSLLFQGSLVSSAGNSVVGTYDYMAPEQRTGSASEPKADLFSLGIILHEMLTGRKPVGHLRAGLLRDGIPTPLIDLIARCLEEPSHRIDDIRAVQEVLAGLEEFNSPKSCLSSSEPVRSDSSSSDQPAPPAVEEPPAHHVNSHTHLTTDLSALNSFEPGNKPSSPSWWRPWRG